MPTIPAPNAASQPPRRRGPGHGIARWTGILAAVLSGAVLVALIAVLIALNTLSPDLSQPDLYALNRPASLTFLDVSGTPAGMRGAMVGQRLSLKEMPPYLPAAFVAAEDRRFYAHHGIDPEGMLRAAWVNFRAGHVVEGGSTITQQLVKMLFLYPDRTMARKLREMAGALALERRLTKQQILELYLNRLYLGSGAYGVDAAAHIYFGKSARDLSIAQAAMLAGLTRAPSAFSPRRDLEGAQDRAGDVLTDMTEIGAITPQQARDAQRHPAVVTDQADNLARNYFLDTAAAEAMQLVPAPHGDLIISTTLDPNLENVARAKLDSVLSARGRALHASQGAVVSMTTSGAIRALVGGRDYAESPFNRATQAYRQPGSAFKAFLYLAAFEQGLTPATVRVDQPVSIQDMSKVWTPDNYTQTYLGPVTLEQAFAKSINTVAVQLGQEIGINNLVAVAHQLGIQSPLNPVPSLALGTSDVTPLEMTAAYASFATLGHRVQPYMVREIRSADGKLLYQRPPASLPQVFTEQNALEMNDLLYQVVQEGTGQAAAVPGHEVAGKTGTSADYRDAWFIGFSPGLVTGVWIGNDDNSPMNKVTGGSLPAQIWRGFMTVALQNRPDTPLPRAEPVMQAPLVAQAPGQDQQTAPGAFDGLGNFFGQLFGNPQPPPAAPAPQRNAQNSSRNPLFFSDNSANPAAPTTGSGATTNNDGSSTSDNTGDGNSNGVNTSGNTGADQETLPPTPRASRTNRRPLAPPSGQFGGPPIRPMPPPAYADPGHDTGPPYGDDPPPAPPPLPRRYGRASQGYYNPPPALPPGWVPPPPPNMPPPASDPPRDLSAPFGQNRNSAGNSSGARHRPAKPRHRLPPPITNQPSRAVSRPRISPPAHKAAIRRAPRLRPIETALLRGQIPLPQRSVKCPADHDGLFWLSSHCSQPVARTRHPQKPAPDRPKSRW